MKTDIKNKIRPLWILFSKKWGGPEQVAMSDMVDLARSGIDINLLCLEGSPVHAAALRHPHFKVFPFNHEAKGYFDLSFIRALQTAIREVEANIIHINDTHLLWYLRFVLFRHPEISIVANQHGSISRSIKDFLRPLIYQRLDYMIVLSEHIKAQLLALRLVSEKKVKTINLGLDFQKFSPVPSERVQKLREEWGANESTIVIGSVGRMVPEVGQDTFLKAAAGLMKYDQWKFKFIIVSEDPIAVSDSYMEELQALVAQFHIEDQVVFTSLSDNLPDVMAAFDIFVMPGREEVPGLGALEALAMERPVVLSNVFGANEIVGNRRYGLLVRPEDAFDLQYKLLNLLQNPSERAAMGSLGRQHVLKYFDKRIRFERLEEVYIRSLKRRFLRSRQFLKAQKSEEHPPVI